MSQAYATTSFWVNRVPGYVWYEIRSIMVGLGLDSIEKRNCEGAIEQGGIRKDVLVGGLRGDLGEQKVKQ